MTPTLEDLGRDELLATAHEWMLSGMLATRALLPLVALSGGPADAMTQVAIDEWMGASPVYTHRMRRLMGIEGDDVDAIIKALQLDVGFVHQYMDVVYEVLDGHHAEFSLPHCGALLDAEPFGEQRVFDMCHTIEDPTFDATALATNPRARIRPIHRPPRVPADREPHCHWTITIDPANDPVGRIPLTEEVAATVLATVPNRLPRERRGNGLDDYGGPLVADFRLDHLSDAALVAVAREFQVQTFLLMAASHLTLRERFDDDAAARMMRDSWLGAGWIASERITRARTNRAEPTIDDLAAALALTPMLPPGCDRTVEVDGDLVCLALRPQVDGLLDAGHAGWTGLLGGGDPSGLEGMLGGVSRRARLVELSVGADGVRVAAGLDPRESEREEPDFVGLNRIGRAPVWQFRLAD